MSIYDRIPRIDSAIFVIGMDPGEGLYAVTDEPTRANTFIGYRIDGKILYLDNDEEF